MRRLIIAPVFLALPLAGCAASTRPADYDFWAGQLQSSVPTADCTVSLPPFGISFSQGLYPPNGTMTTRSDGTWCALGVGFAYGSPSRVQVIRQPLHGALQVVPGPDGVSLKYRAAADYAGGDGFGVDADVGGRRWSIPVTVTVTR